MLENSSDIKIYEPLFYEVYKRYSRSIHPYQIDLKLHLFSLCINHLVSFSIWLRSDSETSNQIHTLLNNNPDLRPEVRNGLSMILIYTFSTAQAYYINEEIERNRNDQSDNTTSTSTSTTDMFKVLQDPTNGFGIVNKTSIKIYNDPFNFYYFLKLCISGLIEAGKIPENIKKNTLKNYKNKKIIENSEEILAFIYIKNYFLFLFSIHNIDLIHENINKIILLWENNSKIIKNRKFLTAYSSLSSQFLIPTSSIPSSTLPSSTTPNISIPAPMSLSSLPSVCIYNSVQEIIESSSLPTPLTSCTVNYPSSLLTSQSTTSQSSIQLSNYFSVNNPDINESTSESDEDILTPKIPSHISNSSSISSSNVLSQVNSLLNSLQSFIQNVQEESNPTSNSPSSSSILPYTLPCYRFERIGKSSWQITPQKIYSIDSLKLLKNKIYLINENILLNNIKNNLLERKYYYENRKLKKKNIDNIEENDIENQDIYSFYYGLDNEFQLLNCLISSWNISSVTSESILLYDYILNWKEQQIKEQKNISLIDFWNQSNQQIDYHSQNINQDLSKSPSSSSSIPALYGSLAWEISYKISIILRSCSSLNYFENTYQIIFPLDFLEYRESTYEELFKKLFPLFNKKFNNDIINKENYYVKYYQHTISSSDNSFLDIDSLSFSFSQKEIEINQYRLLSLINDKINDKFFEDIYNNKIYDFIIYYIE